MSSVLEPEKEKKQKPQLQQELLVKQEPRKQEPGQLWLLPCLACVQ